MPARLRNTRITLKRIMRQRNERVTLVYYARLHFVELGGLLRVVLTDPQGIQEPATPVNKKRKRKPPGRLGAAKAALCMSPSDPGDGLW
jgi:hypothetical protein